MARRDGRKASVTVPCIVLAWRENPLGKINGLQMSSVENHPSRNLGVSLDKLLVEMFLGGRCLLLRTLLSSLSLWCWVLMSPARCICNLQIRKKTTGWVRVSSLLGDFALLPLQAASKYNSQYHKLFKDIPTEESVLKGGQRGEGGEGLRGSGTRPDPALPCSLLLCSPEGHPHPGTALHLPQLALLLREPFWEGHQGNTVPGCRVPRVSLALSQTALPAACLSLPTPKCLQKPAMQRGELPASSPALPLPITCRIRLGKTNTGWV